MIDEYDFIIIDSPPALGSITINAFAASDSVIIPIQCEFYALEGVAMVLNTIKIIKKLLILNSGFVDFYRQCIALKIIFLKML